MMQGLYSAGMWMLRGVLRRKLKRRALAEPEYGQHIEERFGHYESVALPPDTAPPLIWVHAVSLGETRAAAAFIAQLRQQIPGMRLLLTHGTATGRAQGRSLLQEGDVQVWQPWDDRASVQRFVRHFQPAVGLLMETEVWPNLVWQCAQAGVPLCLVNARLSDKSLRSAQRVDLLARSVFSSLAAVWAQTEDDARRLQLLGAPVQCVMGNFKYDATPDAALLEKGCALSKAAGKPVLMFASSREGEEQLWLDEFMSKVAAGQVDTALTAIKNGASAVQWLIVPRHPQRFDEVAQLLQNAGLTVSRRSEWAGDIPQAADVWLGDSLGEMALYFGMADVALLGGSFAPLGGQNLIEAAACGCPVLMGPHTFNFAEAATLAKEAGAAFECEDLGAAMDRALRLTASATELPNARKAALHFGTVHRGAAQRTAEAVRVRFFGV